MLAHDLKPTPAHHPDFFFTDTLSSYHGQAERSAALPLDVADYMTKLRDMVRGAGVDVPITVCPGIGFIRHTGDVPDLVPLVNMYRDAKDKYTLSHSSWALKRDMQDPSKHGGVYANFPSGTSETHRFPDLLRSTVLAGMDAVFQFNQLGFHQQGRYNTLAFDSTDIYTFKQTLQFLWKNTNLK
jgi:hypothetical protein